MSGGKNGKGQSVAHQVIDLVRKIEAQQNGKISELIKKHNDLAAALTAQEQMIKQISAFVAAETGKFQGEIVKRLAILGRSFEGLDINVLALAELAKEIIGQLTQIDFVFRKLAENPMAFLNSAMTDREQTFKDCFKLSEEETSKIRDEASAWYKKLVDSAFKTVLDKRAEQERKALEEEAKAQAEAEAKAKEEEAKQETEKLNTELKAIAEAERISLSTQSGGPGTPFPEGADIFGG